jgi:hypothetical protein
LRRDLANLRDLVTECGILGIASTVDAAVIGETVTAETLLTWAVRAMERWPEERQELRARLAYASTVSLQEAAAFLDMALTKMEEGGIENAPAGDVVAALIEGLPTRADAEFPDDQLSVSAKAEINRTEPA